MMHKEYKSVALSPATSQESAPQVHTLQFPGNNSPLVLVVDDNLAYRLVLCALLEQMGAKTVQAVSGDDAVALAGQQLFDVILMDVGLPDVDGYEASRRIQDASTEYVPIIACTAYDGLEEREAAERAGMCTFITKPAGRRNVFLAVLECLSEKAAVEVRNNPSALTGEETEIENTPLDTKSLLDMLSDLCPDTRSMVLSSVPLDTNASLAIMNTAALNADLGKLEIAAHRLKGLARTFGAPHLAHLTDKLHNLAREGQDKDALACVPEIQASAREMLDALAEQQSA